MNDGKLRKMFRQQETPVEVLLEKRETEGMFVMAVQKMIEDAVRSKSSDIHIEKYSGEIIRIRMRRNGMLIHYSKLIPTTYAGILTRIKVLSELDISDTRKPQDSSFIALVDKQKIDIRVAVLPMVNGEKIVLRILDSRNDFMDLHQLGFSENAEEKIKKLIHLPNGLVLTCGPTGCGKSTTTYTFLKTINDVSKNIMTIEDPVEANIMHINQMQVNEKTGVSFASGLRAILRQDPDVIMVGEIRDEKTAETALNAAITGHLVFSTLHTNDAVSTIYRLKDLGIKGYQIVSALRVIIAQKLVRTLCRQCRKKDRPSLEEYTEFGLSKEQRVYRQNPDGCSQCGGTGIEGRKGIFEILIMTPKIRTGIYAEASSEVLEQLALEGGLVTFKMAVSQAIRGGEISPEEGIRVLSYGY